eukprot:TRINITY_DN123_c1_g1_i1.p1 TRINITY_DN123_c1_g1~~TRINITY_DN123_c1_g1_i1.p1  ORF type:complete len:2603 (+),score=511.57 TRINITY_DN123_c1_g1_i1:528-8336(+)
MGSPIRIVSAFLLALCIGISAQPVPRITTEFPSQVTSGQAITFNLNLDNAGNSFGYGPFVDVLIPPNVSVSSSAAFLDMTLSPSASVVFTNTSTCTAHPVAKFANGTAQTVCGQSGWRFVSYRFPLLSFAPSQPALTATMSGQMPNTAIDTNWSFMARAGFQYLDLSGSPLSGFSAWATNNVSQRLTKTDISFNSTEFSVGPQFIYQCNIVTTLASGMVTVNGTIIVDLPCGVYLMGYSINSQLNYTALPVSPGSSRIVLSIGDGNQTINTAAISLSFTFYLNDTGLTCPGYGPGGIRTIPFSVSVYWSFWSSSCNCTTLYIPGTVSKSAQSIPILLTRSVTISSDANAVGWSPLDSAAHSYSMRVSAGRCYNSVTFRDALADGLVYDSSAFPSFGYNGTGSASLTDSSLTRTGISPSMQIDISAQLANRFSVSSGILRGPSTISIAMPGSVLDRRASGGNIFHGEKFPASAMVLFSELNCTTLAPVGTPTNVSSANSIRIVYGSPSISVYAVNGIAPPSAMVGSLPGVWPTATVTLRMRKSLPTSDIAGLTLDAFLPHPLLLANEASATASLPNWSGSAPSAGTCSMGPADTIRSVTGNSVAPSLSIDAGNNRILFTWSPDYENPLNTASQIDVVCTFTATSLYFPDGLTIGMTSRGSETYVGDLYSFLSVAMMEPVLNFRKTIGSSTNAASVISPANSLNLFLGTTVTSSALSTATFGSSISNVDAGDSIDIALVIENTGSYEAYDISVRDTLPTNFALFGSVSCLTGSQQAVSFSGDLFTTGGATIAQMSRSGTTGSNIIICKYTLVAQASVVASSSSAATGTLFNYAGASSGPDFSSTDMNATVSFSIASPSNTIQIWSTDVAATSMGATYQQVTIGESVTYLVNVSFPEGITNSVSVVVNFAASVTGKLSILSSDVFSRGSSLTTSSSTIVNSDSNADSIQDRVTFTFGTVTNVADGVATAADVLSLRIVTLVIDGTPNARGNLLPATATLTHAAGSLPSASVSAEVVEPAATITKACNPVSPAAAANSTCTITIRATNSAATYSAMHQMTYTEYIPNPAIYTVWPTTVLSNWTAWTVSSNSSGIFASMANTFLPPGGIVIINYVVRVIDQPEWASKNTTYPRITFTSAPSNALGWRNYALNATHVMTLAGPTASSHVMQSTSDPNTGTSRGLAHTDLGLGESGTARVVYRLPAGRGTNCRLRYDAPSSTNAKMQVTGWNIVSVGSSVSWNGAAAVTSALSSTRSDTFMNRVTLTLGDMQVPLAAATNTDLITTDVSFYVPTNTTPPNNDTTGTAVVFTATFLCQDANTGSTLNVELVEPQLNISKSALTATALAGSPLTYTLTVLHKNNSNAPAYDLFVLDPLISTSSVVSSPFGVSVPSDGVLRITSPAFQLNSSALTVSYTFTPSVLALEAGSTVNNTATLRWYSALAGSTLASGLSRTYTTTSNTVRVNVPAPTFTFNLLSSDLQTVLPSSGQRYTFGQNIYFQIVVTFPAAVTKSLQIGFNFPLSGSTARMAFAEVISARASAANLTSSLANGFSVAPAITASGANVSLSYGDVTCWAAGQTLTIVIRSSLTDVASNTHGNVLSPSASMTYRTATSVVSSSVSLIVDEPVLALGFISVTPYVVFTGADMRLATSLVPAIVRQTLPALVTMTSTLPAGRADLAVASVNAPAPSSNTTFSWTTGVRQINMTWTAVSSVVSAELSVAAGTGLTAGSLISNNLQAFYYSSQTLSPLSTYNSLTKARQYTTSSTWSAKVNTPPVAVADVYTINATLMNMFNVSSNDYDIDFNLVYSVSIVTLPIYGDAVAVDGMLRYTARRGFGGANDTFQYSICDIYGQCSIANVTVYNRLNDAGLGIIVPYTFNPLHSQSVPQCPQVPVGTLDMLYLSSQPNCSYAAFDFDLSCYNTSLKYMGTADLVLTFPLSTSLPKQLCVEVSVSNSNLYWNELTYPASELNVLWAAGSTPVGIQWVNTTTSIPALQQWVNVTYSGDYATAKIPIDGSRLGITSRGGRAQLLVRTCGSIPVSNATVPMFGRRSSFPPHVVLGFAPLKFFGAEACERNSDCKNALCVARDQNTTAFCSCNSGWYGADCQMKANSTCDAYYGNSTWLATDFIPYVDVASKFECNALKFVVKSPLVNARLKTEIRFDYNDSSACAYPGFFWTKAISEQCEDMWSSNIPWTLAKDCIKWRIVESRDWISYTAYLVVQHEDNLGYMRGTYLPRYMQHVIPIGIKFPRSVTVSTNITVFAPVRLLAAITEQTVSKSIESPATTASGKLAFDVSLQWPFMVTNVTVASAPLASSIKNVTALSCPATDNSECLQRVALDISPGDACELTGLYTFAVTIVCRPEITNCPLNGPASGTIVADVTSENFCSVAAMETKLNGTLTAYRNPDFTVPQQIFLAGRPSYFLADLTADADLAVSTIRQVWIVVSETGSTTGDRTVFLYNSGITPEGTAAEFRLTNRTVLPNQAGFEFQGGAVLSTLDSNAQINVYTMIDVVYAFQAAGSSTGKRTITTIKKRATFNGLVTTDVMKTNRIVYVAPKSTVIEEVQAPAAGVIESAPSSAAIRTTVASANWWGPVLAALFAVFLLSRNSHQ